MKNRYDFAKKYYKDYVILLYVKNKLYTYKENKLYRFKNLKKLKKLHINYVILDNLELTKKEFVDNKYQEYYLKYSLNNILDIMLFNFKKGIENK